jgi:hypothetical protein
MQAVVRRLTFADLHKKERVMLARCSFTILGEEPAAVALVGKTRPKRHMMGTVANPPLPILSRGGRSPSVSILDDRLLASS